MTGWLVGFGLRGAGFAVQFLLGLQVKRGFTAHLEVKLHLVCSFLAFVGYDEEEDDNNDNDDYYYDDDYDFDRGDDEHYYCYNDCDD